MNQRRFQRKHGRDSQDIARLIRVCKREILRRQWGRIARSWAVVGSTPAYGGVTGYIATWWHGLLMAILQGRDKHELESILRPKTLSTEPAEAGGSPTPT